MKKVSRLTLLIIGIVFMYSGIIFAIPVYNPTNGHTYALFTEWTGTWDDAVSFLGAFPDWTLATITDQAEQDFIQQNVIGEIGGEFWLGGYQDPNNTTDPSANWKWITGEAWNYTHWNSGEPNDNYGTGSEQFLGIWGSGIWSWNDEGNIGNITGFIAETSPAPVPEPITILLLGSGLLGLAGFRRKIKK